MKGGELHEITIEGVAADGQGTVRVGDRTLHVAGGAPGDHLTVRIDAVSKQRPVAFGSIAEVRERGEAFSDAPCHHAAPTRGECGGCAIMHLSPSAQRASKLALAEEALAPLGDALPAPLALIAAPQQLHYRNRSNFLFWRTAEGRVHFGSRKPRSADLARMDGCLVLAPPLADVAAGIAGLCEELEIPIHPHPDGLRHVSARVNGAGEVLVEIVSSGAADAWAVRLGAKTLLIPGVYGVTHSVNDRETNALRGGAPVLLAGREPLQVRFGGAKFGLHSDAFFQLHTAVAERMLVDAAALARPMIAGADGPVWDLYAGTGALGVPLAAQLGRSLCAAESVASAIEAASSAAESVGVKATIANVDLSEGFPKDWPAPALVMVDPPRKGLSETLRTSLADVAAPLLYMSCDPRSFARDAAELLAAGRTLTHVQAYDMLPQTTHIELLALFSAPAAG